MPQTVIDYASGSGSNPWRAYFPTSEDVDEVYAIAFIGCVRAPISEEYKRALKETLEGYCNDAARGLNCNTTTFYANLVKPATGNGFVQVDVHVGALLTDEQTAGSTGDETSSTVNVLSAE